MANDPAATGRSVRLRSARPADNVRSWWNKRHDTDLTKTFDMPRRSSHRLMSAYGALEHQRRKKAPA